MYAVPSSCVREILILPEIVPMPGAAPDVRGVMNLRGKITKVIDLRVRMGLPPANRQTEELVQLLCDREQDHRNWLNELERCVRENQPFTLSQDPHKCKFGIWYDSYQTDNSLLRMTLKNMDAPHQAIHACANEILDKAHAGDSEKALELIELHKKGELALLIRLFEQSRDLLRERQRELAVVLQHDGIRFALTIDSVEAVEHIPDTNIEAMPSAMARLKCRIAKRPKTNETVLLLEDGFLFPSQPEASTSEH